METNKQTPPTLSGNILSQKKIIIIITITKKVNEINCWSQIKNDKRKVKENCEAQKLSPAR